MFAQHAELDRLRPPTPPLQDGGVSDDSTDSYSARVYSSTIEVTLIRAMTGESLAHNTLRMPRDRICSLASLMSIGAEFEDPDKYYMYIFLLANGESVICNGNEYNKLAMYLRDLEMVRKGVRLSDVLSDWSDSGDEVGSEGAVYHITLQQIACAKTEPVVAELPRYVAGRHAAIPRARQGRTPAAAWRVRRTRSAPPRPPAWLAVTHGG